MEMYEPVVYGLHQHHHISKMGEQVRLIVDLFVLIVLRFLSPIPTVLHPLHPLLMEVGKPFKNTPIFLVTLLNFEIAVAVNMGK
jgi:hypothetical protein